MISKMAVVTDLFVFCPPGPEDLENVVLAILVGIIDFEVVNR